MADNSLKGKRFCKMATLLNLDSQFSMPNTGAWEAMVYYDVFYISVLGLFQKINQIYI